jgi:hypothetical protein
MDGTKQTICQRIGQRCMIFFFFFGYCLIWYFFGQFVHDVLEKSVGSLQ